MVKPENKTNNLDLVKSLKKTGKPSNGTSKNISLVSRIEIGAHCTTVLIK